MALWPLLPTAKGLSGSTLYDVPSPDYTYTGAVVNATTISAQCGLLSNLSVGTWNSTEELYYVDVNGLGNVSLPVLGMWFLYVLSCHSIYNDRAREYSVIHGHDCFIAWNFCE